MIRSVIVVSGSGENLYSQSFGATDDDTTAALGGLVSAVHSFGQMLSGSEVTEIQLGNLCLVLLQRDGMIFALAVDVDGQQKENEAKLLPIAGLFLLHYSDILKTMKDFSDVSIFDGFTQILRNSEHLSE
ncbi:MAG: hypothetical protein ACTSQZ_10310 [Candidatus Thorarchaeota archaeon]